MSYIFGPVPYFKGYVRKEYTTNFKRGQGEYLPALFVGIRCQRGLQLYVQAWFMEGNEAGAMYLVPLQACVAKPCPVPIPDLIQPWDVFSPDFGVSRIELFHRSRCYVLPSRSPAKYLFTIDFTGNELADDLEQHKHLHVVEFDSGHFGAFPNNRILIEDLAFMPDGVGKERPDFISLEPEFYSERGEAA